MEVILLRLALAVVFGTVIGIEREWRQKHAGIKTNGLVALGAAGFAIMSNTFGASNHNPAQLAAAVVSGIGFIGAGVILRRGGNVHGVTTAATLWANAAMGVAIGLGHYVVGSIVFVGVVIVQSTGPRIGQLIARRREAAPQQFDLRVEMDPSQLREVTSVIEGFTGQIQAQVLRRATTRDGNGISWRTTFRVAGEIPLDLSALEEQLAAMRGVREIDIRHLAADEEA